MVLSINVINFKNKFFFCLNFDSLYFFFKNIEKFNAFVENNNIIYKIEYKCIGLDKYNNLIILSGFIFYLFKPFVL